MVDPTSEPLLSPDRQAHGQNPAWTDTVETPAFVIEERAVRRALAAVNHIRRETGARVLYALKPLAHMDVLAWMRGQLDGLAVSSLFEAKLGRAVFGPGKTLSVTTPAFREDQIEAIVGLCDHVVLNSLPQWERFRARLICRTSPGLRVNPGLSLVPDPRFDPCRLASKLGVPLEQVRQVLAAAPESLAGLEGLHFHTNCEAERFDPLLQTVRLVTEQAGPLLASLRWMNLGGGYLYSNPEAWGPLYEAIHMLQERYGLTVFLEPGAALVREAGHLVASVVDLFPSGETTVAVLDTTVNHAPEVFEYQLQPEAAGDRLDHPHRYLLAGASCLAGDLFGEYRAAEPLRVGSRLVFPNMGAYTFVKAHRFNGINLPNLYTVAASGELRLRRRYTYEDYYQQLALEDGS